MSNFPLQNCLVVDLMNLTDKYRSFVEFLTKECSAQLYKDDFLVFVLPDGKNQNHCDLTFRWYCSSFKPELVSTIKDPRDHEKLLGKYFKNFDLLIQKDISSWKVIVSTPANQSRQHSVALPCSKV